MLLQWFQFLPPEFPDSVWASPVLPVPEHSLSPAAPKYSGKTGDECSPLPAVPVAEGSPLPECPERAPPKTSERTLPETFVHISSMFSVSERTSLVFFCV